MKGLLVLVVSVLVGYLAATLSNAPSESGRQPVATTVATPVEQFEIRVDRARADYDARWNYRIVLATVTVERQNGSPDAAANLNPFHFSLVAPDGAVYQWNGFRWGDIPCDHQIALPVNGSRSCDITFQVPTTVTSGHIRYALRSTVVSSAFAATPW